MEELGSPLFGNVFVFKSTRWGPTSSMIHCCEMPETKCQRQVEKLILRNLITKYCPSKGIFLRNHEVILLRILYEPYLNLNILRLDERSYWRRLKCLPSISSGQA
jgi:hypothetical protein